MQFSDIFSEYAFCFQTISWELIDLLSATVWKFRLREKVFLRRIWLYHRCTHLDYAEFWYTTMTKKFAKIFGIIINVHSTHCNEKTRWNLEIQLSQRIWIILLYHRWTDRVKNTAWNFKHTAPFTELESRTSQHLHKGLWRHLFYEHHLSAVLITEFCILDTWILLETKHKLQRYNKSLAGEARRGIV